MGKQSNKPVKTNSELLNELIPKLSPEGQAAVSMKQFYKIPKKDQRTIIEHAFHAAFDQIGGIPRLMLWADKNYTEFIRLYSKMIPMNVNVDTDHKIVIQSALQPSTLVGSTVSDGQEVLSLPSSPYETVPMVVEDVEVVESV